MLKLQCEMFPLINVKDMEDGSIGIIREWNGLTRYIGKIVFKVNSRLLVCLDNVNMYWDDVSNFGSKHKVSILPKGTILEVE